MSLSSRQGRLQQRFLEQRGTWDENWDTVLRLNPDYFEAYVNLRDISISRTRLPPKIQEFIYIAVAASCTHMHAPSVKAHIHEALALGASKDEILEVIGLTYLVGIHTITLGAPLLLELIEELNIDCKERTFVLDDERQRIKDKFIARRGYWSAAWNPILQLDPQFFESYADFSSLPSNTNVLEPKVRELIYCAFDAAATHLHEAGTRIHMRNALKLGATPEEVMEMLEITSLMGIHGVTSAVPALAQQIEALSPSVVNKAYQL